jgi:hypothetical protein
VLDHAAGGGRHPQLDLFGPTYVLTLRVAQGRDGVRNLRALLKIAWRHFGLRAIDVRESTFDKHQTHRLALGASGAQAQTGASRSVSHGHASIQKAQVSESR